MAGQEGAYQQQNGAPPPGPPGAYPPGQPPAYGQPATGYPQPVPVGYGPPPTMVMVAAPAPLPTWWPSHPVSVICPHCQVEVSTTVTHETGLGTWLIAGGICFVGCFAGCCLIPFCVDSCKDHNHYCGKCTRFLGKSKII